MLIAIPTLILVVIIVIAIVAVIAFAIVIILGNAHQADAFRESEERQGQIAKKEQEQKSD
jgi:cell division protein FtsL